MESSVPSLSEVAISDLEIFPLRAIEDDRGAVLHMLRSDSPDIFSSLGEIYFSTIRNGAVKAWKRHKRMLQRIAVPIGAIRLVVYDDRVSSNSRGSLWKRETGRGIGNYELITIPALVWYGFQGLGHPESLIANCASLAHDPGEVERAPADGIEIPYRW